jgi:metal-responsive CopG/Arc/MetJ family transcriptional regulator
VKSTLTIRLEAELERELDRACKQTGQSRSDLVRDALRRQLLIMRFRRLRGKVMPLAEARGWVSDEDVFRDLS